MNKKVGGCETVEIRCEMAKSNVDVVQDYLEKTLSWLENNGTAQYVRYGNQMINKYRCVNFAEDIDLESDEMKYYYMHERNTVMADKVAQLIRSSPEKKLFVAFGASHFLGNGSVVDMLREEGFQVERVHAFEKIL